MGLSNYPLVDNLLDVAYRQGKLTSPQFAFQLGMR